MLQSVYPRINNQPIREAAGGGILHELNQASRRKKAKHKGIFCDSKVI